MVLPNSKIQPTHLERKVYVYIRQSTVHQVQSNTGSTQRQYLLKDVLISLGWRADQVVVIDADQAHSGSSTAGRDGFKIMLADVAAREVGALCSIEVSRMARDSADWQNLIKLCRFTDTLVIDNDAIYDLQDKNDRLVLGIKGQMSEIELQLITDRLQGALRHKAQTGELRLCLPTGLVYNRAGKIIHEPNERVRAAVMLVFEWYEQLGTARAVVRKFKQNKMLFPKVIQSGDDKGGYEWGQLSTTRVLDMIHNPIYAGIYVFGRTETKKDLDGEDFLEVRNHTIKLKREEWMACRPDSHEGYISQEQFLKNEEQLSKSFNCPSKGHPGVLRNGTALLQRLAVCGKCGRGMSVQYPKTSDRPVYRCCHRKKEYAEPLCQSIRGLPVHQAVEREFLKAVNTNQIEQALSTLGQIEAQTDQIRRQLELSIRGAEREVELADRHLLKTDPDDDLVVPYLRAQLREKLSTAKRLKRERDLASRSLPKQLSEADRRRVLAIAQEVPKLWYSEKMTNVVRKEMLNCLVKKVILTKEAPIVRIEIQWMTGASHIIEIKNMGPGEYNRTDEKTLQLIREWAGDLTDQQIADRLNEMKIKTRYGHDFKAKSIHMLRRRFISPPIATPSVNDKDERRANKDSNRSRKAEVIGFHLVENLEFKDSKSASA